MAGYAAMARVQADGRTCLGLHKLADVIDARQGSGRPSGEALHDDSPAPHRVSACNGGAKSWA